jgi:hypothetical protein
MKSLHETSDADRTDAAPPARSTGITAPSYMADGNTLLPDNSFRQFARPSEYEDRN